LLGQPLVSHDIACAFGMLAAVALDDQAMAETNKIDDIRADWLLPTEF
jgi:predicted outer membrane lipoprotein